MICPKCGTQNPDDSQVCNSCGFPLSGNLQALQSNSTIKLSGWAIASFICGILTFLTCGTTAILAIVFGILSLIAISRSDGALKGKGIAITGIVLAVIFSLSILPAFFIARNSPEAQRKYCARNMAKLYKAFLVYSQENNGKYPDCDKWCDLLIKYEDVSPKTFICKGASNGPCTYAMNKNIEKLGINAPPDMVLLFETSPGWNQSGGAEILTKENHYGTGCNILFNNGSVIFIDANDANDYQKFLIW